jgi:serine/threonine-protein kinase
VGYEALSGRRAFPQENVAELARAVAEHTPPPLGVLRPDVDPALAAVIERAMAREPGWRFGSADEMRAALAGRIGPAVVARPPTLVLAAPLPDPTTMAMALPVRRNRSRWLLLAAAVIAVLIAAIAFIVDSASGPAVVEPVTTSTSVPPPPTTSVLPPPPTMPVLVEEPPPPKKRGENGNGNGRKPKGGHGGD